MYIHDAAIIFELNSLYLYSFFWFILTHCIRSEWTLSTTNASTKQLRCVLQLAATRLAMDALLTLLHASNRLECDDEITLWHLDLLNPTEWNARIDFLRFTQFFCSRSSNNWINVWWRTMQAYLGTVTGNSKTKGRCGGQCEANREVIDRKLTCKSIDGRLSVPASLIQIVRYTIGSFLRSIFVRFSVLPFDSFRIANLCHYMAINRKRSHAIAMLCACSTTIDWMQNHH